MDRTRHRRGEAGRRDHAESSLADLDLDDLLSAHGLDDVHLATRVTFTWRDDEGRSD